MDFFSFWLGYLIGSAVASVSAVAPVLRAPASPEEQQQTRRRRPVFWWVVSFAILSIVVGFFAWAFVHLGLAGHD
jgi:H+/Cl- antiporter ClcA